MINMIVAMSKNHMIGLNGKMPWHIPEDLKYFKKTTQGHTVLMGRKTYESIGRPLPNRKNIILTRDTSFSANGTYIIHSFEEALKLCKDDNLFIIGGGEIYSQFMPYADKLFITLVNKTVEGDTCFPKFENDFKILSSTPGETLTEDGYSFDFTIWERL